MKLKTLTLHTFRSYAKATLSFHPRINFICGSNATGKTNVLEAIGVLFSGKSFRNASDQDMLQFGQDGYYIACNYEKHNCSYKISYGYGASHSKGKAYRKIKQDDTLLSGRRALIGKIICVLLTPSDIAIIEGGPGHRRRFLDTVLSYQNQDYFRNLIYFNQSLHQRNALLKRIHSGLAKHESLATWNVSLAKYAKEVTKYRQQFVLDFASIFQEALAKISQEKDKLAMRLILSHADEVDNYTKVLQDHYNRDLLLGHTCYGPHRQNLSFERENGQSVTHYSSQGQKRSLVLALRLAQFAFLRQALDLSPILLIDDVLCELDAGRRQAFVTVLKNCGQAIITMPSLEGMSKEFLNLTDEMAVYHISAIGQEPRLRPRVREHENLRRQ